MLIRPILIALSLAVAAPLSAQPTQDEIADARQSYLDGEYEAALTIIVPAAEAGDANAQNILGDAYDRGHGVEADPGKALEWWEKSAAQEFDRALFNLGRRFHYDAPEKAMGYYERAIAVGYAPAMVNLANMIANDGFVTPPDDARALSLYERAAELGNARAMNMLGVRYVNADGVDEDMAIANEFFRRAAALGSADALNSLGVAYNYGYGVPVDRMVSMALYMVAAERGHSTAAINLAFDLIEQGPEGFRNPAVGWAWCLVGMERAEANNVEKTREDCDYLGSLIDEETRAAGAAIRDDMR